MANSNAIRSALKIMNRVLELRYAGLKLKESKQDLRVILTELRNELPVDILVNVERVLKRRAGRDFFNELSTVIYCAEASLRVADQMDGYHVEALVMDAEISAQDKARTQTVARRNSLSHKIGLAFAGASMLFSGMTHAEVIPSYPVDASRISFEGSVAVSIDCDAKKVDVLRESTTAAYFSKQVKKQVWSICYGQSGTLDRVYTFVMNKKVGAHDMVVNNSDRHPL